MQFSSVQSLSRVRLLRPHESQHTRPPCHSPTPGAELTSNSAEANLSGSQGSALLRAAQRSASVTTRGHEAPPPSSDRSLSSEPRAQLQLLTRMQRVSGSLPSGSQSASQCPSVAFTEQNQVATLPVQRLTEDVAAVRDNVHTEDGFQMKLYAHGFTPEELLVQVNSGCLVVTGQRQLEGCNPDGTGFRVAQKVHQQMSLPPDLDPAAITCCLTPSGQLCVRGQCRALPRDSEAVALRN